MSVMDHFLQMSEAEWIEFKESLDSYEYKAFMDTWDEILIKAALGGPSNESGRMEKGTDSRG